MNVLRRTIYVKLLKLNQSKLVFKNVKEEKKLILKQVGRNFSANGHQMATTGFMEYGAIDDGIVDKLRDDDNIRVRLQVTKKMNDLWLHF